MASYVDPAESFSKALGQGLGIIRQYREDERQADKDAFDRKLLEAAEKRAADLHNTKLKEFSWQEEDRPLEKRRLEADTSVAELTARNAPTMQQLEIGQRRAGIASSQASIRNSNFEYQRAVEADRRAKEERREQDAWKELFRITQTGQGDWKKVKGTSADPIVTSALAGNSGIALDVLDKTSRGDMSWMKDPQAKNAARLFTRKLGGVVPKYFRQGTESVQDFYQVDGKNIGLVVSGIDKNTGKATTRRVTVPADKMFDQANLYARTFNAISKDENAKQALVTGIRMTQPELYNMVVSSFDDATEKRLKYLDSVVEAGTDETGEQTAAARQADDQRKAIWDRLGTDTLFQRFANYGAASEQPLVSRAIDTVTRINPKAGIEGATRAVQTTVDAAMQNDKVYTSTLARGGLTPKKDKNGRIIKSEADVFLAISRFKQ